MNSAHNRFLVPIAKTFLSCISLQRWRVEGFNICNCFYRKFPLNLKYKTKRKAIKATLLKMTFNFVF